MYHCYMHLTVPPVGGKIKIFKNIMHGRLNSQFFYSTTGLVLVLVLLHVGNYVGSV